MKQDGTTLPPQYILGLKREIQELRQYWQALPNRIRKAEELYKAALLFAEKPPSSQEVDPAVRQHESSRELK